MRREPPAKIEKSGVTICKLPGSVICNRHKQGPRELHPLAERSFIAVLDSGAEVPISATYWDPTQGSS